MAEQTTPNTGLSRAPNPGRHAVMTTGAVAVVAGPAPGRRKMNDLLARRFAQSYGGTPGAAHVQRAALPAPGDDSELFGVIAHALEQPLETGRPWECWIIEGLAEGRWALLVKTALEPGAAHLLTRLCDDDGAADPVAKPQSAQAIPGPPGWADSLWQAAARAVTGVLRPWPAGNQPPAMRRYRSVVVPRRPVDQLARKFGVTADDVAFAAVTESFRTALIQRGEQPRADALRVSGPVLTTLPVEHQDPIQQLRAVHASSGRSAPPDSPLTLCAKVFHALTRQSPHAVTLAPAAAGARLRLMGRRVERVLPIPPIAPGVGVTVISYDGDLVFGITADYDTPWDINGLAAGIEAGVARLIALNRDSVVLFDRRRKRRTPPNSAARWRPPPAPARVRH